MFQNILESSRSFHIKGIYRECEYLPNDNKVIDMDADHELKMNLSRREIRVILLHEFRLDHKATEAANNICSTMGEDVLSIRTAQH
jgi:hypothetical protein